MTLYEYYIYHANVRKEIKPIEEYKSPALFWCDLFHIYDKNGNPILDIWGA